MTSILQNATKDKIRLQLKRIAVGGLITIPLVIVIGSIVYLAALGVITPELVLMSTSIIFGTFMLWSIGGAYESYSDMRRKQKEYEERKTHRAFERLGNGNT